MVRARAERSQRVGHGTDGRWGPARRGGRLGRCRKLRSAEAAHKESVVRYKKAGQMCLFDSWWRCVGECVKVHAAWWASRPATPADRTRKASAKGSSLCTRRTAPSRIHLFKHTRTFLACAPRALARRTWQWVTSRWPPLPPPAPRPPCPTPQPLPPPAPPGAAAGGGCGCGAGARWQPRRPARRRIVVVIGTMWTSGEPGRDTRRMISSSRFLIHVRSASTECHH